MSKIELNIVALADSVQEAGNFALILEEDGGSRRLSILIGAAEAQSIAIFLEDIVPPRPLTHDLFKNTLAEAGVVLEKVQIHEIVQNTFHALLVGKKADGSPLRVDARSSDAIALALRWGCPIYTTEEIMQAAGVEFPLPESMKEKPERERPLSEHSLPELQELLSKSIEQEDYENAATLRDLIRDKRASLG